MQDKSAHAVWLTRFVPGVRRRVTDWVLASADADQVLDGLHRRKFPFGVTKLVDEPTSTLEKLL